MIDTVIDFLPYGLIVLGVISLIGIQWNTHKASKVRKKLDDSEINKSEEQNEEQKNIQMGKRDDETGEEFIERMKKVRNSTHDDIEDSENEKEEKIFRLVDEKFNQICLDLEKDIEMDASGKFMSDKVFEDPSMSRTSLGWVQYELENEDGEELRFLTSMLFEKKIVTRESYKKLNKKCQELKSILEIKLKQYDDSLRTHWASPGSVTYEII